MSLLTSKPRKRVQSDRRQVVWLLGGVLLGVALCLVTVLIL